MSRCSPSGPEDGRTSGRDPRPVPLELGAVNDEAPEPGLPNVTQRAKSGQRLGLTETREREVEGGSRCLRVPPGPAPPRQPEPVRVCEVHRRDWLREAPWRVPSQSEPGRHQCRAGGSQRVPRQAPSSIPPCVLPEVRAYLRTASGETTLVPAGPRELRRGWGWSRLQGPMRASRASLRSLELRRPTARCVGSAGTPSPALFALRLREGGA